MADFITRLGLDDTRLGLDENCKIEKLKLWPTRLWHTWNLVFVLLNFGFCLMQLLENGWLGAAINFAGFLFMGWQATKTEKQLFVFSIINEGIEIMNNGDVTAGWEHISKKLDCTVTMA